MGNCEMCGSDSHLVSAIVEGTRINVCKKCTRFGKVVMQPRRAVAPKRPRGFSRSTEPEEIERVVDNYSNLIKKGRELKGIKQEEVAKDIAEKTSLIQKMESNQFKPSLVLARKLERYFGVTLIEKYAEERSFQTSSDKNVVTIGDRIKIKKR